MPDAYLLISYGGPDTMADVIPFLKNATRGRRIPESRLEQVGQHYALFNGRSPLNDINQKLVCALREELATRGDHTPVAIGNRNWKPFGSDAMRRLYDDGARDFLALSTSAYGCYSACRQYREDLARWVLEAQLPDVSVRKVRPYWDTAGFFESTVDVVREALEQTPQHWRLVFVTHSIPSAMNDASGAALALTYEQQHRHLAQRIAEHLGVKQWDLAFCSRSGRPQTPWLEPDINQHIEHLAANGVSGVTVIPFGFISDHMEVVFDLDTEAHHTAQRLGLGFFRGRSISDSPVFIKQIADLLQNPGDTSCPHHCCLSGMGHGMARPVPAIA